jgi:hypothetical protein
MCEYSTIQYVSYYDSSRVVLFTVFVILLYIQYYSISSTCLLYAVIESSSKYSEYKTAYVLLQVQLQYYEYVQ